MINFGDFWLGRLGQPGPYYSSEVYFDLIYNYYYSRLLKLDASTVYDHLINNLYLP